MITLDERIRGTCLLTNPKGSTIRLEHTEIEMELAKEEAHLPLLPPFPQKPYKASTIVLFAAFGSFVAFAAWVCFKELVIPFFR